VTPAIRTKVMAALLALAVGCGGDSEPGPPGSWERAASDASGTSDGWERPEMEAPEGTSGDTIAGSPSWTRADWDVLVNTARWAWDTGVDTLPIGERVATIGQRFVGSPYVPRTLDPAGAERLVVNLRVFDCVTFVESALTLAHFVRTAPPSLLDDPREARALYERILRSLRYRGGTLDGYASRLHYFSEWLTDNAARGWLRLLGHELDATVDPERIDFMTAHRDAYDQLVDEAVLQAIGRSEGRLSKTPRLFVPQERLDEVADHIRTGDVIAATSTLEGLDVAHTGIALRTPDGVLRLMHAPLVGKEVQISDHPLVERLRGIDSQDGVMVARPLERPATIDVR